MKTLQKIPMQLIEVEFIPENSDMEPGKFYYSEKYQTGSHVCVCGCGDVYPVPIKSGEWVILDKQSLTITPSFAHRIHCKAHYVITGGNANLLQEGLPKSMWHERTGFQDTQPGE
jgi:hypothetical protein